MPPLPGAGLALDADLPAFPAVRSALTRAVPGLRLIGLLGLGHGAEADLGALRVNLGLEALVAAPGPRLYRAEDPEGRVLGGATPSDLLAALLGPMAPASAEKPLPPESPTLPGSRPILALVGPMAVGKSSVGRHLSRLTGLPFIDADDAIVAEAGRTIPELFATEGEAGFRAREEAVLGHLLEGRPAILATGGGAVLSAATRAALARRARTIWLHASPALLAARATGSTARPLLAGGDPEERLRAIYAVRLPLYRSVADYLLPAGRLRAPVLAEVLHEAIVARSHRLR